MACAYLLWPLWHVRRRFRRQSSCWKSWKAVSSRLGSFRRSLKTRDRWQTQTELLREARVVFTEQVLLIALKLKGTDTGSSKAKTLVSEQEAMITQGKDGMQETGLQPCLWKAARTLLG